VGDFGTIGDIGLGACNSRGASGNVVGRGPNSDSLGVRGLSVSTIGGGGPASCVLGSSSNSVDTIGSGVSGMGTGDGDRSLPRAITATHWARLPRDQGIKGNKSSLIKVRYLLPYLLQSSRLVSLSVEISFPFISG
jgi:hypothetical protein